MKAVVGGGPVRRVVALALALFSLGTSACSSARASRETPTAPEPVVQALNRSLDWLEGNRPDWHLARLGTLGLDAWGWYVFATWHPQAANRERAGRELDQRLRELPLPVDKSLVALSYWGTLLRLMEHRGIDSQKPRDVLATYDLSSLVADANPTTAWWTAKLLQQSGLSIEPDFSKTFIATGANTPPAGPLSRPDAYRIFHELVPLTDMGSKLPPKLTTAQLAFIRRVLPE